MSNESIEEIQLLLGLRNKEDEIKQIIKNKGELTLLEAISLIICSPNTNDIFKQEEESKEDCEMYEDFTEQLKIKKLGKVNFKGEMKKSNFSSAIFKNIDSPERKVYFTKQYKDTFKNFGEYNVCLDSNSSKDKSSELNTNSSSNKQSNNSSNKQSNNKSRSSGNKQKNNKSDNSKNSSNNNQSSSSSNKPSNFNGDAQIQSFIVPGNSQPNQGNSQVVNINAPYQEKRNKGKKK